MASMPSPPNAEEEFSQRLQSRPWSITREQTELRVRQAVGIVGTTAESTHEGLASNFELPELASIRGLDAAARELLAIWYAVRLVNVNRLSCWRLAERCAVMLYSVREDIVEAGDQVEGTEKVRDQVGAISEVVDQFEEQLPHPIFGQLIDLFTSVHRIMQKQIHRPLIKQYLKWEEVQRSIQTCHQLLNDAIDSFSLSTQTRILKRALEAEEQRGPKTPALGKKSASITLKSTPALRERTNETVVTTLVTSVDQLMDASPEQIRITLQMITTQQVEHDTEHDTEDLRRLMRSVLQADEEGVIRILQIKRDEMPEATKALQRVLEIEIEHEGVDAEHSASAASFAVSLDAATDGEATKVSRITAKARAESRRPSSDKSTLSMVTTWDTLHRRFIERTINALTRLSSVQAPLPSWTISRYEVDIEEKIGIGLFSDVYRGKWRNRAVAIKLLTETVSEPLFVDEVTVWKELHHPNILELLGTSSTSSDPPWYSVSPFYENGDLVSYLKRMPTLDSADAVKAIYEIANGMAYLHGMSVLHGNLQCAQIFVDDDGHCVIADFGQNKIKSEVSQLMKRPMHSFWGVLNLRWQAPEVMFSRSALAWQADVYAFGICCIEILSKGGLPWPLHDDDTIRRLVLWSNERPDIPLLPDSWWPQLVEIIKSCWRLDPALRPSFVTILQELFNLRAGKSRPMTEISHARGSLISDEPLTPMWMKGKSNISRIDRHARAKISKIIHSLKSRRRRRRDMPVHSTTNFIAMPTPLPSKALPIELWEYVIDWLQDDPDTLMDCRVVCRAFRVRSGKYLQEAIDFGHRNEVVRWGLLKMKRWRGPRKLTIHGGKATERGPIPHLGTWSAMLAGRWTRTSELSICNAEWYTRDMYPDIFLDLPNFTSITELTLRDVTFPTPSTFGRFICALPGLRRLDCQGLRFSTQNFRYPGFPQYARMKLSAIAFQGDSIDDIVNFVITSGFDAKLDYVYLGNVRPLRTEDFKAGSSGSFIQVSSILPRETYLTLVPGHHTIDLSHNSRLEAIYMTQIIEKMNFDHGGIGRILSLLTSNVMKNIILDFDIRALRCSSTDEISAILTILSKDCCSPLDETLTLPKYAKLQIVFISVCVPDETEDIARHMWSKMLMSQLPRLHNRQIIRTNVWSSSATIDRNEHVLRSSVSMSNALHTDMD